LSLHSLVLLSVRTIGYKGHQCSGGESVSQCPLKTRAFSTFLDQNPPFELQPKMAFASDKSLLRQSPVIDNNAIKRLAETEAF
jgi:hypothetical protein